LQQIDPELTLTNQIELEEIEEKPKSHLDLLAEQLTKDRLALVPRSFDTIGDLVVIEIPDELWDIRQKIGKSLLNVHSSINGVFAKAGKVQGTKRIRPLEFLAGENRTTTIYKEHGLRFKVDMAKAYFSPRLSTEHNRVANQVKEGEIVVDLFCGIGPFAIPIAHRTKSKVYAIDINPEAIELLKENKQLNKLQGAIIPLVGDCREVVKKQNLGNIADRVIMNLPGYAINFVDIACKVLKKEGGIIHFFEFVGGVDSPEEQIIADITKEVEKNNRKVKQILEVRRVRMSAPKQWQMVADVEIA
jgi:tRNA (guanine37-N1)-methyltransferase